MKLCRRLELAVQAKNAALLIAVRFFNDNGGADDYTWLPELEDALDCAHRYGPYGFRCLVCGHRSADPRRPDRVPSSVENGARCRFRNPTMRTNYLAALVAFNQRSPDLFLSYGTRRQRGSYGSSFATYFWRGFDGEALAPGERALVGYAFYRAGQDAKAAQPGPRKKSA